MADERRGFQGEPVRLLIAAAVAAVSILPAQAGLAQNRGNPEWHGLVLPYLYLSNIDGSTRVRGFEFHVGDDHLETDFAGRIEVGKGRWGGIFEFQRGRVGNPIIVEVPEVGPLQANSELEGRYDLTITNYEFLASYELAYPNTARGLEILAGIRHVRHSQDLDLTAPTLAETVSASWTEPVVGFRYYTELGSNFWFIIQSNIGGFGVGSEFTWVLDGELGYALTDHVTLAGRYRYLQTEYTNGKSGDEEYAWDEGQSQGWLLGVGFTW